MKKISLLLTAILVMTLSCILFSCGDAADDCTHEWGTPIITLNSTCTREGSQVLMCTLCSKKRSEAIPALGHSYGEPTVDPATCTTGGSSTRVCVRCLDELVEVIEPGHNWAENKTTDIPATCLTDGVASIKCLTCKTVKEGTTEVIAATGHSYGAEITKAATCQSEGKKYKVCAGCADELVISTIPTSGHNYVTTSSVAATCQKAGSKTQKCSGCGDVKTTTIPATGNHSVDTSALYIKKAPTETSSGVRAGYCSKCYSEVTYTYTYSEYQSALTTAKGKLSGVNVSAFGTSSVTSMSTTKYSKPTAYPTVGEHPRLLVTADVLEEIRECFAKDPDNIDYLKSVIKSANGYTSGILGDVVDHDDGSPSGEHNLEEPILYCAMSKAFLYLLGDAELYAVDAIRLIKEYISTMKIEDVNDECRNWGYARFAAAIVYDWCYDVMSDQDRLDFVRAVEKVVCAKSGGFLGFFAECNMEIGFPPSDQNAICGHGSERQLLRDYLSFALAIYDEYPTWYEFIGGRFFQEYVPVRNDYYTSGMYPQGISIYVNIRFTSDLWSAWLMQTATGKNPYSVDQKEVIHSLFSRVTDGAYYVFDEGDDKREVDNWGREIIRGLSFASSISSYLYDDPTAAAWAKYIDYYYTDRLYLLILRSSGVDEDGSRHKDLDLICYNGGFLNEIVAHNGWTSSSASVLMKIGGRITANHDHGDAGSFQIYYKGLLAGDSGFYDSYESTHHKTYHQATIAHNSIVIYRNGKSYGQKAGYNYTEPSTYTKWLSDTYKTADLLGVEYEYDTAGKPRYAYIAGDITPAYQASSTSYAKGVERRMLAVFETSNSSVPLFFFVYDRVSSGKATDQKTFLLHTVNEPTVSGNTVTATHEDGGKLVLQSVIGGDKIEKIGGADKNYVVNGSQVATKSGQDDGYWGRVEISPATGNTTDTMLNVMYVTNKSSSPSLTAKSFRTDKVAGAIMGSVAAVFVEDEVRYGETFAFTAPDTGSSSATVTYYVSGVKAGTWTVNYGTTTVTATATEDGGLLVFKAPAGTEITLVPSQA